ncbi:radical SAM/SPASM domain-containing protein [Prosthecochloris ethylica]|uniref:radical SAM/SPASM domain-containing protein n=1 Tax=Prosthecochloris ethylica TaxID=2743976 RepID=UPI0030844392
MSCPAVSYLILVLTRSCNLSCMYCYEGVPECEDVAGMSLATAEEAIMLAAESGDPFHLQLSGGEPLLEPDTLAGVIEIIRSRRLPATIALQTNGVLLDREMIRLLKNGGVSIGLSVDGPPRLQEELRGGSRASYGAMRLLDEEGVPFRVTAVVSDRNVRKLHLLAMSLSGFSMVSGIALDLLVRKGRAAGPAFCSPPSDADLQQGVLQLLETLCLLNRERARPIELREQQLVTKAFRFGSRRHYCAASSGASLAVTPEGLLYPCTQTMGDESFFLGTLHDFGSRETVFRTLSADTRFSACDGCRLDGRCPGECPSRLVYNGGHQDRLCCTLYRTILDYCVQTGDIIP